MGRFVRKMEEIFMGYYDNIAVRKTERELLDLWKTKEPVTRCYVDKKQFQSIIKMCLSVMEP